MTNSVINVEHNFLLILSIISVFRVQLTTVWNAKASPNAKCAITMILIIYSKTPNSVRCATTPRTSSSTRPLWSACSALWTSVSPAPRWVPVRSAESRTSSSWTHRRVSANGVRSLTAQRVRRLRSAKRAKVFWVRNRFSWTLPNCVRSVLSKDVNFANRSQFAVSATNLRITFWLPKVTGNSAVNARRVVNVMVTMNRTSKMKISALRSAATDFCDWTNSAMTTTQMTETDVPGTAQSKKGGNVEVSQVTAFNWTMSSLSAKTNAMSSGFLCISPKESTKAMSVQLWTLSKSQTKASSLWNALSAMALSLSLPNTKGISSTKTLFWSTLPPSVSLCRRVCRWKHSCPWCSTTRNTARWRPARNGSSSEHRWWPMWFWFLPLCSPFSAARSLV